MYGGCATLESPFHWPSLSHEFVILVWRTILLSLRFPFLAVVSESNDREPRPGMAGFRLDLSKATIYEAHVATDVALWIKVGK